MGATNARKQNDSQFFHRKGSDSTYDSICLRYLETVATKERESKLRHDEANHICKWSLPGYGPKTQPQCTKSAKMCNICTIEAGRRDLAGILPYCG